MIKWLLGAAAVGLGYVYYKSRYSPPPKGNPGEPGTEGVCSGAITFRDINGIYWCHFAYGYPTDPGVPPPSYTWVGETSGYGKPHPKITASSREELLLKVNEYAIAKKVS